MCGFDLFVFFTLILLYIIICLFGLSAMFFSVCYTYLFAFISSLCYILIVLFLYFVFCYFVTFFADETAKTINTKIYKSQTKTKKICL